PSCATPITEPRKAASVEPPGSPFCAPAGTANTAATSAARARRRTAARYRRREPPPVCLQDGGFAEQRLHLGIEVGDRGDAVVGAELERLRARGRLQREYDL